MANNEQDPDPRLRTVGSAKAGEESSRGDVLAVLKAAALLLAGMFTLALFVG